MQKLQFEPAWEKTLSIKDRERIEHVFEKSKYVQRNSVHFTRLWQAVNHEGDLLVTVLLQNTGQQILSFQNKKLHYIENNLVMAEHTFTLPSLTIEPETSMPWTFIFPVESLYIKAKLDKGHVEIVS